MKGEKVPRIIPPGGCRAGEFSKTLVSCTTKGRKRRGRRRGGYGRHDLQHVNFFFSLLFFLFYCFACRGTRNKLHILRYPSIWYKEGAKKENK